MFIKYDEHELLELFLSEPVSIADNVDAGELIYSYKDNKKFKLILTMDVYRQTCSLGITHDDFIVFTGNFKDVTSIKKVENDMIISVSDHERLKVKFLNQVGVELL
ncbi:hypothetical protein [Bacillus cereus group sp. BfR-BA-01380]|uniref:hypothetical protein n=1 Tax=Bacillus cereus group sp. BfR-BA-01380 TaxID=2920324 RepID=UPI001F589B7E|nr:hypothetical protein [Bacillus cereus group sp. BfR-BA-01380]